MLFQNNFPLKVITPIEHYFISTMYFLSLTLSLSSSPKPQALLAQRYTPVVLAYRKINEAQQYTYRLINQRIKPAS